jgi:hypothetical protein
MAGTLNSPDGAVRIQLYNCEVNEETMSSMVMIRFVLIEDVIPMKLRKVMYILKNISKPRISKLFGIKIDWSDHKNNANDSIRVHREFDWNEIDESDSQYEKQDEKKFQRWAASQRIEAMNLKMHLDHEGIADFFFLLCRVSKTCCIE